MKPLTTFVLASLLCAAAPGGAIAHHSFAMFDTEHPIEISGTVKEFRWVSPHSILIIEVKEQDGTVRAWTLEGGTPSLLRREGLSARSLKPGDEVVVKVNPLHSGAAGGSFVVPQVKFRDGRSVLAER